MSRQDVDAYQNSAVLEFESTLVNLLVAPEARALIEPAHVGVPEDWAHFMLSLWVDDVDAVCSARRAA